MNKDIVIIYKEVGKKAELKKIKNELKIFENLIGGELEYMQYEDVIIIFKKNQKYLQPNIYVNTEFLSIGKSIRGNVIIACKENEYIKSLSKDQAIKYLQFLKRASFNYDNFDEKGRYIPKTKNYKAKNKNQFIINKEIEEDDIISVDNNSEQNVETKETLKMILGIQSIILKFIKNNTN